MTRADHGPISVNGNAALLSLASSEGWQGSGSQGDPVIISGYRIFTSATYSVSIRNTDLHLRISNMNITNSDQAGILLQNARNVEISSSIIYSHNFDCIRISSSSYIIVDNSTFDQDDIILNSYNGIRIVDSSNVSIVDNHLARMTNDGISVSGTSADVTIRRNVVEDMLNNGISLSSDSCSAFDNEVVECGYGIRVSGSGNIIKENWARGYNGYGIYVTEGSRNRIMDNIVTRNTYGIAVIISTRNVITGNYIGKSASFGMDLYCNSGSSNIIHSNHFYYNNGTDGSFDPERIQARDLNGGNIWYDESAHRGNFWFDWRGNDNNEDGIVDLSYTLMGRDSRDPYPILNPDIPDVFVPPWGLTASPDSDRIVLQWYAPWIGPGISIKSYQLYRSERGGGELYLTSIPGSETTYTDFDVRPGRAYWYYVVALNDIAYTNRSNRIKSSPDTKRPSVSIDFPKDGTYFNTSSVEILYTGSDNIALDRFEIVLDDEFPLDNGLWTNVTFDNLSEGIHHVDVTAFDLAEHQRTASVTFTVDLSPPFISFNVSGNEPLITGKTDLELSWNAYDPVSGVKDFRISLDDSSYSSIGIQTSYLFHDLEPGYHDIRVQAYDMAGNHRNDSVRILVDPDKPHLSIHHPVNGYMNNTGDVLVAWTGTDSGSGVKGYSIRYDLGDWIDIGIVNEYLLRDLDEGVHHIYVKALDLAGNEVIVSSMIIVDRTPPLVNIQVPEENGLYSEGFILEWTASDLLSGIGEAMFKVDNGSYRILREGEPFELEYTSDGVHRLVLEVRDGAGNSEILTRQFYFDTKKPRVVSALPTGRDVPVDTSVIIEFSEQMNTSSVKVDINDLDGSYEWKGCNLTFVPSSILEYDKKYSIQVTGSDPAGNRLSPFSWYFITEVNLTKLSGLVRGFIMDVNGTPIANASIRFASGERTYSDGDGWFSIILPEGDNHLIISFPGYRETKFDFRVKGGEILDLGDIPIRPETGGETSESGSNGGYWIVVMTVVIVILLLLLLIGWQVKRTIDYKRMPPVEDEWFAAPVPSGRSVSDPSGMSTEDRKDLEDKLRM